MIAKILLGLVLAGVVIWWRAQDTPVRLTSGTTLPVATPAPEPLPSPVTCQSAWRVRPTVGLGPLRRDGRGLYRPMRAEGGVCP